jgi:hypothetical protein
MLSSSQHGSVMALIVVDHKDHCILETFDSIVNSLAASEELLANDLPESENLNIDLEDAFDVNDSPDLANLIHDNHLSVFSVSAIDSLCAQTLCLLAYGVLFQPSPYTKFLGNVSNLTLDQHFLGMLKAHLGFPKAKHMKHPELEP